MIFLLVGLFPELLARLVGNFLTLVTLNLEYEKSNCKAII